jgi:hypothetical protein
MAELVSLNAHNLSLVYNLSRLGLDMRDIALYFGVSDSQFDDLCEKHPEFLRAYDEGKSVRDKSSNLERNDG